MNRTIEDLRAELVATDTIDPDFTEEQLAGYQAGWNLAAATPIDGLTQGAFSLICDAMHNDRSVAASNQLLGFLHYHQSLTQKLSARLLSRNWISRLSHRLFKSARPADRGSSPASFHRG